MSVSEIITVTEQTIGIQISDPLPPINIEVSSNPITVSIQTVGTQGPTGEGVATGGTTGQYLVKLSNADFDTGWASNTIPDVSVTQDGIWTKEQYAALGFAMARDLATPTFSKELIYTLGVLTKINIWEDPSHTTKMYEKTLNYTLGVLTSVETKRMSDNAVFTKTLSYTLGTLTGVDGA